MTPHSVVSHSTTCQRFSTRNPSCRRLSNSLHPRAPQRAFRPAHCRRQRLSSCRALDIDWSDPDTLIGVAGAVLGLALGIGAPVFYLSRDAKDKAKLEYVRDMNRKRFEETGEYMTDEEIKQIRTPKWTDRREFADDD